MRHFVGKIKYTKPCEELLLLNEIDMKKQFDSNVTFTKPNF